MMIMMMIKIMIMTMYNDVMMMMMMIKIMIMSMYDDVMMMIFKMYAIENLGNLDRESDYDVH